jgi:hypothetical protein
VKERQIGILFNYKDDTGNLFNMGQFGYVQMLEGTGGKIYILFTNRQYEQLAYQSFHREGL